MFDPARFIMDGVAIASREALPPARRLPPFFLRRTRRRDIGRVLIIAATVALPALFPESACGQIGTAPLDRLEPEERRMIENACLREKYSGGPLAFKVCADRHVSSLDGITRSDLGR